MKPLIKQPEKQAKAKNNLQKQVPAQRSHIYMGSINWLFSSNFLNFENIE